MNDAVTTYIAVGTAIVLVLLALIGWVLSRRPRSLDTAFYESKWAELQKLLKDQTTWPLAIINADKLLDHALKSKRYKGKTMGERLVAAQRDIQGNDDVWFGHKLRNKLVHENGIQLREQEVKNALMGFKRALKDLEAL
ncbi:hypothetical protein KBD11_00460 [Candidatus Saccharibacteria bacterium]|nr:hypothetical protein [Candidatus Saccharibacteria bacterium]